MTIKHNELQHYRTLLREHGLRVTDGRIALLQILARQTMPQSINALCRTMKPRPDKVTLYRTLEAMEHAGIIRRVDLRHAHTHYELVVGRKHHHHLVCTSCGKVNDVEICGLEDIEQRALEQSHVFASVQDHTLELFGVCKTCAHM